MRWSVEWRRGSDGMSGAGQAEQALGNNVELHFARAALDRVGLAAQPAARGGAVVAALALPLQGLAAPNRHQQLIAPLVQLRPVVLQYRRERGNALALPGQVHRSLTRQGKCRF